MAELGIAVGQLARTVKLEVRITGARLWSWRVWLAARIFRLAAFVCGTQIEVSIGSDASFDVKPIELD